MWEEGDSVAHFKDKNYSYGFLLKGETIAEAYRVSNLPTLYVVGTKGEIIYHSTVPDPKLTSVIEKYLATE